MFGGNIDMNRINNILSSMNREGYDINGLHEEMKNHNFNNGMKYNNNPQNEKNIIPNDLEKSNNLNNKDVKKYFRKSKNKKNR